MLELTRSGIGSAYSDVPPAPSLVKRAVKTKRRGPFFESFLVAAFKRPGFQHRSEARELSAQRLMLQKRFPLDQPKGFVI